MNGAVQPGTAPRFLANGLDCWRTLKQLPAGNARSDAMSKAPGSAASDSPDQ
jgi:hypothetical protein